MQANDLLDQVQCEEVYGPDYGDPPPWDAENDPWTEREPVRKLRKRKLLGHVFMLFYMSIFAPPFLALLPFVIYLDGPTPGQTIRVILMACFYWGMLGTLPWVVPSMWRDFWSDWGHGYFHRRVIA